MDIFDFHLFNLFFVNRRKVVRIENVGIVLYRKTETEIIAFGNKCSHYGAPLINGMSDDD